MRLIVGIIAMAWCLIGCSELRVIGAAAMRELHAEALPVNWETTPPAERTIVAKRQPDKIVYSARSKSFSSFRSAQIERKKPVKGLWEQRGG